MDLSIIIVNWKSVDYLDKCLHSIFTHVHGMAFEVIVIDNASFDGSAQLVRENYPRAKFVQCENNLGFASANNLAFNHSQGYCLLFLNPDTEIVESAVSEMFAALQSTRDAGIVGCKLLNSDRSVQTSCIQAFPTIVNQALDFEGFRKRFPQSRLWGMAPLFSTNSKPAEVEVVSGACLMIRRSVFKSIGMFSTEYFMYAEDVDLCFKASSIGWKAYYVAPANVVHHGGGSSSSQQSSFSSMMMRQSIWQFMRKRHGAAYALAYRMVMALVSVVRLAALCIAVAARVRPMRSSMLRNALSKWASVLRWTLGAQPWARPRLTS